MAEETTSQADQVAPQATEAPAAAAPVSAPAAAPAAPQGREGGSDRGGDRGGGGGQRGGGGGQRGGGGGQRGGGQRGGRGGGDRRGEVDESGIESSVIRIYRCSKVVKGGRTFSFGALVAAGDRKGQIGLGYGKANEVPSAVEKATKEARRSMIKVSLKGTSIPHITQGRIGASSVTLVPARAGTGVTAGKSVRPMLELAGVTDILSKAYGSTSPKNLAKATLAALKSLRSKDQIALIRKIELPAEAGEL